MYIHIYMCRYKVPTNVIARVFRAKVPRANFCVEAPLFVESLQLKASVCCTKVPHTKGPILKKRTLFQTRNGSAAKKW